MNPVAPPPLKVLHVEAGKHLYGGARQVLYLLEGLMAHGVVSLLAAPAGSATLAHCPPGVRTLALRMGGDADAGMLWRLLRLIRAERPDLVHLHSRRGADLWGALAARLAGVPVVLSRRVDNPQPRWLVASQYRLYDHVIAISEGIRQVLLNQGLSPARVSTVRSALDATPFLAPVSRAGFLAEFGLPPDALTVGMVAQLIARKGHRHLLAALPAVLARFPQVRVLIFGQGPLEAELRAEVARSALAGKVCFAGFRNDLPRWLGGLDVLAHPADMEGLGIALLQAAAAAVPVIACRAGGMPEAVADGQSGLLIAPGDVEALVQALNRLLGDAALRRQMGQAGRARMLAEFSVERMVKGNLACYRAVLDARSGR